MTVNFKLDYILNLHNRHTYIIAIEHDGKKEEDAYKLSTVKVNRIDIKSIHKASDGSAIITMKNNISQFKTVEEYTEVMDVIHRANLALNIMNKEKVYIFDDFEVDSDELKICDDWKELIKD